MRRATLAHETDFDGWRSAARAFRQAGVPPEDAVFRVKRNSPGLFDNDLSPMAPGPSFFTPRAFVDLAQSVILHRSADRFDLLYRLLWRMQAEPDLIRIVTDVDVTDAMERARNVSRASHKMKAFLRFRRLQAVDGERWVAWFEPAHRVLERTAPFFVRRFSTMRWAILTPEGSASFEDDALTFGPPASRDRAPSEDEIEEFWKTYYASTFNPARLRLKTMRAEMPKRYWNNLPEAALIRELAEGAAARTETMVETPATEPNLRLAKTLSRVTREPSFEEGFVPSNLDELGQAVQACRRCPLWRDATQGVCGSGARQARLMIVGEQPGDREDLAGRPFVGPAGQVLDEALSEAGIDRDVAYVTNAVKHFKNEPRGKRRIHKTPLVSEIRACRWWLVAERRLVKPKIILALGATAAFGVLNRKIDLGSERGELIPQADGVPVVATTHPSYLLRIRDEASRRAERRRFVEDLRRVRSLL